MEQGVNMEQLKGTIFYERSDSMAKMAKPLGAMLGEMENVFNSKSGYGYKYAPLNDVLDKARPVLAKHGFGMTQLGIHQRCGQDNREDGIDSRLWGVHIK